jgi:hypothetical protein
MELHDSLWNIFSFYSLQGNYLDPSRLSLTGLFKICTDSMLFDPVMVMSPLTRSDVNLFFRSTMVESAQNNTKGQHVSINGKREKLDKMNFIEFIACVRRIATKCYPPAEEEEEGRFSSNGGQRYFQEDESLQQLLMDNILPMASIRKPVNIEAVLEHPTLDILFGYYR